MPVTYRMSCHAWNKDKSQLAFSPNNNEVHICREKRGRLKHIHTLAEHDMRITGIDWAPNTNRIATCSADHNAYVWTQDADRKWNITLVLLRINRAATCVKWSPSENKFAVGCGASMISICYFKEEDNWWVSKHIKRPIRSTVTALDWHPKNILLLAGSADFKVRIFSALVEDIEVVQPGSNVWGTKLPFGQLLAEFPNSPSGGGWVHDVSFSADGNKVAWVGHGSSVNVADATQGKAVIKQKTEHLPFLVCTWVTNYSLVVAGHNRFPLLYFYDGSNLIFLSKAKEKKEVSRELSALEKFQALDRLGRIDNNDIVLDTAHQNPITSINIYEGTKANATEFSTSSSDRGPEFWTIV